MSEKIRKPARKPFPFKPAQLMIGASVVLAVTSFFLIQGLAPQGSETKGSHGKNTVAEQKAAIKTRKLLIATGPILAGSVIEETDLQVADWPEDYYPEGLVFEEKEEVLGHVCRKDILPGEPIYRPKITGTAKSKGGLTAIIPQGMRAVTIEASDIKGVAGFIKPGDRVDVLAKVSMTEGSDSVALSRTVLQNTLVLACEQDFVDQRMAEASTEKEKGKKEATASAAPAFGASGDKKTDAKIAKNITLALWPDEVEKLMLAEEMGSLRLSLREESDFASAAMHGVTEDELFMGTARRSLKPKETKPTTLQDKSPTNKPVDDGTASARATESPEAMTPPAYTVELLSGTDKSHIDF